MSLIADGVPRCAGFLLEEEGGFNPLQLGSWTLWLWTLLAFGLLFWLLSKYAWGPLTETVKGREQRIAEQKADTEKALQEAEELRAQHKKEMEEAAQRAKAVLDEARERAESLRGELETKAREEAKALIARAQQTIEQEKQQAVREIKDQVVELSVAISSRLARRSLDREDHLREADELLEALKRSG